MKLIRSAVVAALAITAVLPSTAAFAADPTVDSSDPSDAFDSSVSAAQPRHDWATPIGALRTKSSDQHNCSGSVIQSPAGDVVLTAAHCVLNHKPGSLTFYPDWAGGHANSAYGGAWQVVNVVVPKQYKAWHDSHPAPKGHHRSNPYDFAFLVLKNKNHPVQWYTGALSPQIKPYVNNMAVTIAGYPTDSAGRVQCTSRANGASYQGNWYVRMDCPTSAPIPDGTSGSPWIQVGTNTVVGLEGGYEEGGDTDFINYSPWFQETFASYYNSVK